MAAANSNFSFALFLRASSEAALLSRAQNQRCGPLWSRMHQRLPARQLHDIFHAVETGVNGLRPQRAFKTAANNEHRSSVHQTPDGQDQPIILLRSASDILSQTLAHQ